MDVTTNIGRTIARERRRAGVTQEALAAHLGVSKAAVSKWELGLSLPDVSLLPRIAAYFSLTLDELFDWRARLSEEEAAEVFARVCAEGHEDVSAARESLRRSVSEHFSDWNLLLMMSSLLTTWSAMAEQDEDAQDMRAEAGELLDRVLAGADDPGTIALARQAKATALFSAGDVEGATALLEPLVRRGDDAPAMMLLASCYRRLGREGEAAELLQSRRLAAGLLVVNSLLQEIGTSDDAAFVLAAADAARAVSSALAIEDVNPLLPVTLEAEVADALLRAGEKDEALAALERALDAAERLAAGGPAPSPSPLLSRALAALDPERHGAAWAEHKRTQLDEARAAARAALVERLSDSLWEALAAGERLESLRSRAASWQ